MFGSLLFGDFFFLADLGPMKRSRKQADPGSEATSHGTWSAKHWRSNDWSSSWSWGSWGWHWRSWDWDWQQWCDDDPEIEIEEVEEEGQDNEASQTEGVQKGGESKGAKALEEDERTDVKKEPEEAQKADEHKEAQEPESADDIFDKIWTEHGIGMPSDQGQQASEAEEAQEAPVDKAAEELLPDWQLYLVDVLLKPSASWTAACQS